MEPETKNRRTVLSVQFTDGIGFVTSGGDPAQPGVCEFCEPGPRNGPYSVPIEDIRNEMDGQNGEGDRAGDGGRVPEVGAEEW